MMLAPGTLAPEFALPDQHGNVIRLIDQRGHWVLLWWYPAAQTPGCTIEGQNLRDHAADFAAANCTVFGASFDTIEGNLAFAEMQGFRFSLLSDVDHTAGVAYQVVRRGDDNYERFSARHSYLIDPDGVIRRGYDVSDVESHADEVLADLRLLSASND